VNVFADVGVGGDGFQDVIRHILGVGGGKPDAQPRSGLSHQSQQAGKGQGRPTLFGVAVGIYILSEQRHFFIAFFDQVGQLSQDAFRVAAALPAPGVRDDAVITEVVATPHDGNKAADAGSSDAGRQDTAVGFGGGQVDVDGLFTLFHRANQVGKIQVGIRPGHQIDVVILHQCFFDTLGHTAQDAQN